MGENRAIMWHIGCFWYQATLLLRNPYKASAGAGLQDRCTTIIYPCGPGCPEITGR